jgi:putative ubiquitin-RnfH superfamily antitoxin RatB of RatAB toxin-antitoxin module
MADQRMVIEVVLALPGEQVVRRVTLPAGATVMQALAASNLLEDRPGEIDPDRLGVFSRRVTPGHVLSDGDRVEIYRSLTLDPKDARRQRARRG